MQIHTVLPQDLSTTATPTFNGVTLTGDIERQTDDLTVTTASQKTVVLSQPVWKDINLATVTFGHPSSIIPDEVQIVDNTGTNTGIYTWGFDVNEYVSGGFELQHDYKEGSDLYFHIHWQGSAAPTGTDNVKWQLIYIVSRDGATVSPATTITTETGYDTAYEQVRSDFTAITGTNFKIGDQFMFTIGRVAASADEYAGDAITMTLGVHYQIDTIGSRQIGTK